MNVASDIVNLFITSSIFAYGATIGWRLALKASPAHAAAGLFGVGVLALFEV